MEYDHKGRVLNGCCSKFDKQAHLSEEPSNVG